MAWVIEKQKQEDKTEGCISRKKLAPVSRVVGIYPIVGVGKMGREGFWRGCGSVQPAELNSNQVSRREFSGTMRKTDSSVVFQTKLKGSFICFTLVCLVTIKKIESGRALAVRDFYTSRWRQIIY